MAGQPGGLSRRCCKLAENNYCCRHYLRIRLGGPYDHLSPIYAEGIELRDIASILPAENAPTYAGAVTRVLTDDKLNQQLRAAGPTWVEETYAWRAVYRRVDQVYAKLLATTQTSDRQVITA